MTEFNSSVQSISVESTGSWVLWSQLERSHFPHSTNSNNPL